MLKNFCDIYKKNSRFVCSEYFEDIPRGDPGPSGVRCEDVTRLTFSDERFDLIISQDVFEHVSDPMKGFAEVARVLRPGGVHIFTIPYVSDLAKNLARARVDNDRVTHFLPPIYYGDPVRAEGALVFTDFGADLAAIVREAGMELSIHNEFVFRDQRQITVRVFEAVKLAQQI